MLLLVYFNAMESAAIRSTFVMSANTKSDFLLWR